MRFKEEGEGVSPPWRGRREEFSSQKAQEFGLQEREVMPKQGLMETLDT